MTKFAAYDNHSIYAIGDTAGEAIVNACDAARDPDAQFETAPIGDELAAWIDENGWNGMNRSFEIDRSTGRIVDTTESRN